MIPHYEGLLSVKNKQLTMRIPYLFGVIVRVKVVFRKTVVGD